jgi:hypothetical protein
VSGDSEPSASLSGAVCGERLWDEANTARTTLGWGVDLRLGSLFNSSSALSSSQRAQQMVLLTHSGEAPLLVVSWNSILSHRTKASSRWTRIRGLVPT